MPHAAEQATTRSTLGSAAAIPPGRRWLLFALFFLICCGLGYPSLNRVDWRQAGGLADVSAYANLVVSPPTPALDQHMQFRILVPYLARPIYRMARGRIGSWDPIMLGLLVVDSFFTAWTALLLVTVVNRQLGSYPVALGSALLFLLNFAVPNLRLAGFVDAGEAFFLMLLVWALFAQRYWMLPIAGILGATAKESFVPFLMVFALAWWLSSRRSLRAPRAAAAWMAASWLAALATLTVVQFEITHVFRSPLRFGLEMHGNSAYLAHFLSSFRDRNFWYIFCWLLPLGLIRLNRLPRNWRMATAATCVAAFALDAYYGGEPGTIGRALFSVAGPLLSASVALLLFTRPPATPTAATR
ncbi:MAG: hypothetical protein ABSG84_18285 [Acidobacteriaceae bacterium]|jgi:hypothetical protein